MCCLEPATKETSIIVTKLLDEFNILTSVDGPFDNVLVIKPPMRFNEENVDYFVSALETVLKQLPMIDMENVVHTPT